MKKKIGDLTIEEARKICRSIKGCPEDCPLNIYHEDTDTYDCCGTNFADNTDEDLNQEIEVKESE